MIASARILHHTACLLACVRHFSPRALQGGSSEDLSSSPELHGRPLSPVIPGTGSVLLRYTYEGASIAQGRLCTLEAEQDGLITGRSLLLALQADGVDFGRFYACAYETEESSGGWLPVLRDVTDPADSSYDDPFRIPTVPPAEPTDDAESGAPVGRRRWRFYPKDAPKRRRVDCKLCRRDAALSSGEEAARTEDKRTLGRSSFSALGVVSSAARTRALALALASGCDCQHGPEPITPTGQVGVKNEENVGTLWRSAYQLGVSMLFTARREPPYRARP